MFFIFLAYFTLYNGLQFRPLSHFGFFMYNIITSANNDTFLYHQLYLLFIFLVLLQGLPCESGFLILETLKEMI